MRDPAVIDELEALERYARAFDAISAEQDAHYSARSFAPNRAATAARALIDRSRPRQLLKA